MKDYLKELNEEQLAAVLHSGTPLLIMAGAGSGKTKTLAYKAVHLIDEGLAKPDQLLLVTFTNKAAKEMKERVEKVSGKILPNVGTFHSISARILRKSGHYIGINPEFVIYDDSDQEELIKEILAEKGADIKRFKPRAIMSAIGNAKQEMIDPASYQAVARGAFQELAAEVYTEFQKRLVRYGALDFDDLLFNAVKLLRDNEEVREKYQDAFPYLYVDEYQDTNTSQYLLTKFIANKYQHLTVVGDASQSIYKWRGADYRNMQKLRKDYPNLTELQLTRNYRSTQNILDAATRVISNNRDHSALPLWTDAGKGEKIKLIESYSANDEAKRISIEINKLLEEGYKYKEIAILYRTNSQSRALEEVFVREGMPYVLVGGTKFYERKEIKDVLCYVRVFFNHEDRVSYKRAEKLGKRRLEQLLSIRGNYKMEGKNVRQIIEEILAVTKYMNKYDEKLEEDLARIENIKELTAVAAEFDDLPSFLENVALVQAEYYTDEKTKNNRETLTLMTLHAAKGLEFPVIFIVGLEEGLFPHARSLSDNEELEEERRLMYVGITRAKKRLYLSYAKSRVFWGAAGSQTKSRFIGEIPAELISQATISSSELLSSAAAGNNLREERDFWQKHTHSSWPSTKIKTNGVRIDSLSDDALDDFLSGNLSVEELLNR